jgi:hypothetical protein
MIKQLIIATCVILGASLVVAEDNPIRKVEGAADLEKVKRARFRETYVNTNTDFTRYSSVLARRSTTMPAPVRLRNAGPFENGLLNAALGNITLKGYECQSPFC